jgi:hypothetical protein
MFMSSSSFRRVYIEVVTHEDLETPLSIENMLFQLCEYLHQQTALVQLHIVHRTESLAQLASGPDLIPSEVRIETRTLDSSPFCGHAANLRFACSSLDAGKELHRRT